MGPWDLVRKVFVQTLQHNVAALAIDLANQFDVLVEKSVARNLIGDVLVEP